MNAFEKALATAGRDVVKSAEFVAEKILPALQKASASAATVEAITSLVSPSAAAIETAAYAVLGKVIAALEAAAPAANASGLNISLDSDLVADVKAIAPAVKAFIAGAAKA